MAARAQAATLARQAGGELLRVRRTTMAGTLYEVRWLDWCGQPYTSTETLGSLRACNDHA